MKKIRAIYIGDIIHHNQCPVFELNKETDWFEMIEDSSFKYEKDCVNLDSGFLVFKTNLSYHMVIDSKSYKNMI